MIVEVDKIQIKSGKEAPDGYRKALIGGLKAISLYKNWTYDHLKEGGKKGMPNDMEIMAAFFATVTLNVMFDPDHITCDDDLNKGTYATKCVMAEFEKAIHEAMPGLKRVIAEGLDEK